MNREQVLAILSTLALLGGGCTTARHPGYAPRAERLTIHFVGEYGGVPWAAPGASVQPGSRADRVKDLNLAVSSINLSDHMPPAFLEHWAQVARWGHQQGKAFLPRVYFWDGNDRFEGPLRDIDVYWGRMARFLDAMDLNDFYGICLAEENVNYAGRPAVLQELYRRIKARYRVRVYQWLDNAVPDGELDADGWVVDPYNLGGQRFRRFIQRYLVTGKPVVVMPWASWDQGEAPWAPEVWQRLEDQLQVCREYNLPTAFYWTLGMKGQPTGGVGFGMTSDFMGRIDQRIFDWIKEVRALPPDYRGLPSADSGTGGLLELGPDATGVFNYRDRFQTSQFVEDADTTGFRDLLWVNDHTLSLRSFDGRAPHAVIVYKFAGDFPAHSPEAVVEVSSLAPESRVAVSISRDGRRWQHAVSTRGSGPQTLQLSTDGDPQFAGLKEFRVRVDLRGRLRNGNVAAKIGAVDVRANLMLPAEPTVTLKPDRDHPGRLLYEDDFQTRKYRFTTVRTQDEALEWSRGRIAVRMRPAGSNPTLVWKVKSGQPLRNIRVEVDGQANNRALGTNHYLDVSADGRTWSHPVDTTTMPANPSGWTVRGLAVDLSHDPAFAGRKEFYVRLRMSAPVFEKIHPSLSGIVTRLRIEAEPM